MSAALLPAAIVFAGSRPVAPAIRDWLPPDADVVAADSGLGVAIALGLHVDHLVGDLDSADAAAVTAAEAAGTTVDRHPAEKDATDLELALDAAIARGARRVVVVDGGGDRLDHLLGNLLLLASSTLAGTAVEALAGTARIAVVRGGDPPLTIDGAVGSFVTLLPVGGPARGIVTDGLRYPLRAEELPPGTTRGVSNELAAETASDDTTPTTAPFKKTVVLMTHDSFLVSKPVLAAFTKQTGYVVKVLKSGDAGEAVHKAILVKDRPVADAFFGVDNTFLTQALDAGLFEPYTAKGLANVPAALQLDDQHRVTPIDTGDVCVNDDLDWFGHDGHPPAPASLADLAKPAYRKLLVVENPVSSSPGLAFLLATIVASGENGWHDYWKALRDNDVRVVNGWEEAYYTDFTAGGGSGDRPLVVSYASDPAADVVFSDGKKTTPTVGVVPGTCFAQVEVAGVLAHGGNPAGARALIDFMLTRHFQADVPLQMYVYPAVSNTPLPKVFRDFAQEPVDPYTMTPTDIGKNRRAWTDEWTQIVLQ